MAKHVPYGEIYGGKKMIEKLKEKNRKQKKKTHNQFNKKKLQPPKKAELSKWGGCIYLFISFIWRLKSEFCCWKKGKRIAHFSHCAGLGQAAAPARWAPQWPSGCGPGGGGEIRWVAACSSTHWTVGPDPTGDLNRGGGGAETTKKHTQKTRINANCMKYPRCMAPPGCAVSAEKEFGKFWLRRGKFLTLHKKWAFCWQKKSTWFLAFEENRGQSEHFFIIKKNQQKEPQILPKGKKEKKKKK